MRWPLLTCDKVAAALHHGTPILQAGARPMAPPARTSALRDRRLASVGATGLLLEADLGLRQVEPLHRQPLRVVHHSARSGSPSTSWDYTSAFYSHSSRVALRYRARRRPAVVAARPRLRYRPLPLPSWPRPRPLEHHPSLSLRTRAPPRRHRFPVRAAREVLCGCDIAEIVSVLRRVRLVRAM